MAGELVRWKCGMLWKTVTLEQMCSIFEGYGNEGLHLNEIDQRLGGNGVASRLVIKYPLLRQHYELGIDGRTVDAEATLLKRCMGYKETEKKVTRKIVNGSEVERIEQENDVLIPPDVGALRLFLKGRANKRYNGDDDMKVGVVINLNSDDSKL